MWSSGNSAVSRSVLAWCIRWFSVDNRVSYGVVWCIMWYSVDNGVSCGVVAYSLVWCRFVQYVVYMAVLRFIALYQCDLEYGVVLGCMLWYNVV